MPAGAHEHARRQLDQRVREMLPAHQRPAADGVDDAAAPEEGRKRQRADGLALRRVMQGRVGMRADVRRQRDRADVDRAARAERGGSVLPIRRVAGEDGRVRVHRR
ncbi:hypothetical protein MASR1M6_00870 [Rubrivivax sp.]